MSVALFALLLFGAPPAPAQEVPIDEWLRAPGARLVAVVSLPQKCDGCAKEIQRWRAFTQRHHRRGLRVIAVVGRDPMLGCVDPGWKPDAVVCDALYDGIAKHWLLRERSTTAFLWSWKGELLVNRGDLGDVERAVKRQLASSPQLVIDARGDLKRELREAVDASNKYHAASDASERARLTALEREPRAALPECARGSGLDADAVLHAAIAGGRAELTLRSEQGCRLKQISIAWDSAKEAIAALFAAIPRRVELPQHDAPPPREDGELMADGATPEGQLAKSKQYLARLEDPIARQLAKSLEKYLGRTDLRGAALVRAVLRESRGVDVGELLPQQLDSGPEVALDLRAPERTLVPGDLIFYVSYAYVPKVVVLYLGAGLVAESADVRGVVVGPLPTELPYFFQPVARRPLTDRP